MVRSTETRTPKQASRKQNDDLFTRSDVIGGIQRPIAHLTPTHVFCKMGVAWRQEGYSLATRSKHSYKIMYNRKRSFTRNVGSRTKTLLWDFTVSGSLGEVERPRKKETTKCVRARFRE